MTASDNTSKQGQSMMINMDDEEITIERKSKKKKEEDTFEWIGALGNLRYMNEYTSLYECIYIYV